MVGHQTPGNDFQPVLLTVFLEPAKIRLPVFIRVKNIFTAISTLGNVVRYTSKYGSRYSEHGETIIPANIKLKGSVPFYSKPECTALPCKTKYTGRLLDKPPPKLFVRVPTAKNYLSAENLASLNNLVEQYLVFAEGQAMRRISMTTADRVTKLDGFLNLNGRNILNHAGKMSHQIEKQTAE